jgi:transaldolase
MKFFVDTADTVQIKSPASSRRSGVVNVNPSLVAKNGKKFTDIIREIRAMTDWSKTGQTIV